jgi:Xaa-Pro aminopeptidase
MVAGNQAPVRLGRLRVALAHAGLDAFFIRDLSTIKWVSAFEGVFDDEAAHALVVTQASAWLHTDGRYVGAAAKAAKGSGIAVDASPQAHGDFLAGCLGAEPGAVGIESTLALGEFRKLEAALARPADATAPAHGTSAPAHETTAPAHDTSAPAQLVFTLRETEAFVAPLRAVKDAGEIECLKAAQAITDAAFAHIVGFIRVGMTEREVQRELEDFMLRRGASALAFPSIVATGKNAANPHAIPGDDIIQAGQALVLDFGARVRGYCSDMTRTLFLGQPEGRLVRAYDALRKANEAVEAFLKPGVTGAQAQGLAESLLAQAGFEGLMTHSLGHGVGIDVHESPVLATRNTEPLVQGNVVTVEPGIYCPADFGMRLEDFGVITDAGFEVFTQSSHEMVIIDRFV